MTDSFSVGDKRQLPFTIVEHAVMDACDHWELVVYLWLARHLNAQTGRCNPSHDTLAEEVSFSKRKLRDTLKSLRAKGLIDWEKRWVGDGQNGAKQTSNHYSLSRVQEVHSKGTTGIPEGARVQEVQSLLSAGGAAKLDKEKEGGDSSLRSESPSCSSGDERGGSKAPSATQRRDAEFAVWYSSWPRKVGKADARKAWERIKPDADARQAFYAATTHYLASVEQYKQVYSVEWPMNLYAFPATFLNGLWQDFAEGATLDRWPVPKESAKEKGTREFEQQMAALMGVEDTSGSMASDVIDVEIRE